MNVGYVLPQWEFGEATQQIVEYAVEAEQAGWDGVFLADHLVFPPGDDLKARPEMPDYQGFSDPWMTLAGIAVETSSLTLASWVTPIPRRQPWQVARDLATLDQLSDGRVMLGTGLGRGTDYKPFGREYNLSALGDRYDEALDIIHGLWTGERFSYDGEYYQLDGARVLPTPVQRPRIPIVIGGLWPHKPPIDRGARWDGIIPHYPGDGIHPDEPVEGVAPEDEVRDMIDYYTSQTDNPAEILLPENPPHRGGEWLDLCVELGATWVYRIPRNHEGEWDMNLDRIREGPPEVA